MTYLNMVEDERGDLVDLEWFCSAFCYEQKTGQAAHGHAWPCPEQQEYDVPCAFCEGVVIHGYTNEQG